MKIILIAGKDLEEFERTVHLLKENIWGVYQALDQGTPLEAQWQYDTLKQTK